MAHSRQNNDREERVFERRSWYGSRLGRGNLPPNEAQQWTKVRIRLEGIVIEGKGRVRHIRWKEVANVQLEKAVAYHATGDGGLYFEALWLVLRTIAGEKYMLDVTREDYHRYFEEPEDLLQAVRKHVRVEVGAVKHPDKREGWIGIVIWGVIAIVVLGLLDGRTAVLGLVLGAVLALIISAVFSLRAKRQEDP